MASGQRRQSGALEVRGLQAGTYVLNGRPQQTNVSPNAIANYAGHQEITISESDVDGIVFALPDPLEITGTVRVESGGKYLERHPCLHPVLLGGLPKRHHWAEYHSGYW